MHQTTLRLLNPAVLQMLTDRYKHPFLIKTCCVVTTDVAITFLHYIHYNDECLKHFRGLEKASIVAFQLAMAHLH